MRNQFRLEFLRLAKQWDSAIRHGRTRHEYLDFSDCVFVGDQQEELPGDDRFIDFSDLSIGESISFARSQFCDTVWFGHSRFHKSADFSHCSFAADADFSEAQFHRRLILDHAQVNGTIAFRDVRFHSAVLVERAHAGSLSFNDCIFESYVALANGRIGALYMRGCQCLRDINSSMVSFEGLELNTLQIVDTQFFSEVSLRDMEVTSGEWIGGETPPDMAICLDGIRVNGLFQVKGRSPSDRLFQHRVALRVGPKGGVKGSLTFENVNVFHLDLDDEAKSLLSARPPRIVYGPGCNSFRLHREFQIPIDPAYEPLMHEVAQTFVSFFNQTRGAHFRLGVDCEFRAGFVTIRYHAEADLSEQEFFAMLERAAPEFYAYLTNADQYLASAIRSRNMTLVDVCRRVWSLAIGLAANASLTSGWTREMTRKILVAVSPRLDDRAIEYHTHITSVNIAMNSPGVTQISSGRDTRVGDLET